MSGHIGVYRYACLNLTFLYWRSIGNVLHWCRRLRYVWLLINCTHRYRLCNFLHRLYLLYSLNCWLHRSRSWSNHRCHHRLLNHQTLDWGRLYRGLHNRGCLWRLCYSGLRSGMAQVGI